MMYVLQKTDKGNPQETAVYKPEKAVLPTAFLRVVLFSSCSATKMYFFWNSPQNPLPLPLDFHIVTGSFSRSQELHKAPQFRRASQSLGKG